MKIKKILLNRVFASTLFISSPIVLISAGEANGKPDDKPTKPQEPKKEIDKNFDKFKQLAENKIKEAIDKAIDETISFLKTKVDKIGSLDKPDDKYYEKLEQKIHLLSLISYFKNNKQKIIEKPDEYGFPVRFPYVIANEKKYNVGIVKFNGKTYNNIKMGKDNKLNYSELINPEKGDLITIDSKSDNFITEDRFKKELEKYTNELIIQAKRMVDADKDIPKIGKDIFLIDKEVNDPANPSLKVNGLIISSPVGFKTWSEYIINRIKPKFVEFDLKQNEQYIEEVHQNNAKKRPVAPVVIPPLVPKKDLDAIEIHDANEVPLEIPSLKPLISYKHLGKSMTELKNIFDSSSPDEKNKMFFFNNPINTRYKYFVKNLSISNVLNKTQLTATVQITDTAAQSDVSRNYAIDVEMSNNNSKNIQFLLENQIRTIRENFVKLYKSVGLDERLNYPELGNNALMETMNAIVAGAVGVINKDKIVEKWSSINDKYKNHNIDFNDPNNKYVVQISNEILSEILLALHESDINGKYYWNALADTYDYILNDKESGFKSHLESEESKKAIKEKFKELNLEVKYIDKLVNLLNFRILKFKSLSQKSSKWVNSLNLHKWFDEYISDSSIIKNKIDILSKLLDTKKPAKASKEEKELIDSYNEAVNIIKNSERKINNSKTIIGSIFIAISLMFIIVSIIIFLIKKQKIKGKNFKTVLTVSGIISLMITVIGLIMLILGIKG
ncbi:hypothetical protein LAD74_00555 [Mycoplasma sp. U97]|uniref:MSC_0620 family F1-like ATPase-associated subunit n=1 Tax=Mycoplasma tauri TaxID=547987 RepID=UPI001CBA7E7D|nr:hypothetical protein [Mycoplasma tauri]MBZ4212489.1 hypothetical protein [Mycoplasma tauri]